MRNGQSHRTTDLMSCESVRQVKRKEGKGREGREESEGREGWEMREGNVPERNIVS